MTSRVSPASAGALPPAEALERLRAEWRAAGPAERCEIERQAAAVQLFALVLR